MIYLEKIQDSLKESLKINILTNLETGNPLLDSLLRMIILTFFTSFIGKIIMIITDFRFSNIRNPIYYILKRPKKLVISGGRYIELKFMCTRFDFSLRFKATLNKIVKSLESRQENAKLIRQIKELQVRDSTRYYDHKEEAEFNFIVDQDTYFEIEDNIYCNINIRRDSYDNSDKKTTVSKEEYIIELWSSKMNCNDLLKYVEKITDEYEKEQKALSDGKRFIFKFDGSDSETGIKWVVNEFRSKRTLDQVFFEEKSQIMDFLERFVKERELYDKIGKPWQLGILLEGEPGCGKTSFIIGLANYLNRSIKDCQFNRMKTIDDLEGCIGCVSYDNKDMSIDKVIMVAEDFDCMSNIAKSRKLVEKEYEDSKKRIEKKRQDMKEQMASMKSDEAKAIMCAITNQEDDAPILVELPKNDPTKTREITLSNLLNILDGINSLPGRIIIFSTNCPDSFDDAFLRPGRIDLRVKFGRPSRCVMYEMMHHWYSCIDEYYSGKELTNKFKINWEKYENKLEDFRHRPCDITNIMQKCGDNIEQVFLHLLQ